MTADSRESGLSRWSRRKLESQQPEPSETALLEAGQDPDVQLPLEAETESTPVLTDADMPAIETLDEDSDFSVFMSAGVSDKLRNLALRKLFKAPVFNLRDGLDEYDEDYTYFEKLGDIVTCDMKHQVEMQEQKRREAAELEAREAEAGELDEQAEAELEEIEDMDDSEEIEDDDDSPRQPETLATADSPAEPENRQQKTDE